MLAQRAMGSRAQIAMVGLGQSLAGVWNAHVLARDIRQHRLVRQPAEAVRILGTPLADDAQPELVPVDETPAVTAAMEGLLDAFPEAARPAAPPPA
jgi:hypothetical protein